MYIEVITGEDHPFNIKDSPLSTLTFPRRTFQIALHLWCHKTARLACRGEFMLIEIAKIHFKHVRNGPRRPIFIVSHDTSTAELWNFKACWLDFMSLCRWLVRIASWERSHIPPMEVEHHFPTFKGDMWSFPRGYILPSFIYHTWSYCWWKKSCTTWDGAKTL